VEIFRKQKVRGVFLAEAFTTVTDGYVMTSILNIIESEIEIDETVIELEDVDLDGEVHQVCLSYENRERVILDQLRFNHLNSEERI
jgi:CRISPR/Cas system CMR subunit Cmr4 (Cas7 group RAMP superfamily)